MWVRGVLMTVTDGVGQKWRFISPQYEAAAIAAMAATEGAVTKDLLLAEIERNYALLMGMK